MLARLSYNDNGWIKPSGPNGKSRNSIHEFIYGFGFEEWLFNKKFKFKDEHGVIWNIGYIEAIHKNYRLDDEQHSIQLFTIDSRTRNRYLVAEIKKWKKLTQIESATIIAQNPNLIIQMQNDLNEIENDNAMAKFNLQLNNPDEYQLFNIKFREVSYCFNDNNFVNRNHDIYNLYRFHFYREYHL